MVIQALAQRGVYQRDIAETVGVHPKTVQRALTRGGAAPARPKRRPSLLDAYRAEVDRLLAEGVWNGVVIFRELQTQGYCGGISILRDYIRPKRALRPGRATVRFETPPGQQLQCDWGEIETVVGGQATVVHFLVNTLGYSRRFHFWGTRCEDAEHTYEGLIRSADRRPTRGPGSAAGAAALGDELAAVAGHLAQLAEQTRRDMARQGEAELADAGQPQAVVGIRLFTADLLDVLGVEQDARRAWTLHRQVQRGVPALDSASVVAPTERRIPGWILCHRPQAGARDPRRAARPTVHRPGHRRRTPRRRAPRATLDPQLRAVAADARPPDRDLPPTQHPTGGHRRLHRR